jgi:hypothetical protein
VTVKTGGVSPFPRSGLAFTAVAGGKAYAFGGVRDEEGEEDLAGTFLNDAYSIDLESNLWRTGTWLLTNVSILLNCNVLHSCLEWQKGFQQKIQEKKKRW